MNDKHPNSHGVGTVEIIVVLVLIGILAAFAIPQLIGSRRLIGFTNIQQRLTAELREARQAAISRNRRITVQYDDNSKTIRTFEEPTPTPLPTPSPTPTPSPAPSPTPTPSPSPTPPNVIVYGLDGDPRNRVITLVDGSLGVNDIVYGAPPSVPLAQMTLADTSPFACPAWTPPTAPSANSCLGGVIDITFNPRGDVVVPATGVIGNNKALFFYENNSRTTFAVSILAPGGRIKIWRFNGATYE